MQDRCGVTGIKLDSDNAAISTYYGLYALQHRGQEGAGIVSFDGFKQYTAKGLGLVGEVFSEDDLNQLKGNSAIGHVRYSTSGSTNKKAIHPFHANTKQGFLAMAHNGNLTNIESLREDLEKHGHVFITETDTEVMIHELAKNLADNNLIQAIKLTMKRVEGAYSATLIYNDKVIGCRDPRGIRPLCIGKLDDGYMLASESVALNKVDGKFLRDVEPGEIIILDDKELKSYQTTKKTSAHCFFEYIYFARPDSTIDGRSTYKVRRKLGEILYENYEVPTGLVSPVPDSGRAYAAGYAEAKDMEYIESMMKNRYVGRTFIMPSQETRGRAVKLKLNPIKSNIKDKKITLIDDSIVRGTISKTLVKLLKEAGAKEVHLRIGAPPLRFPCSLGIDMVTEEELIASDQAIKEIKKEIGADSLEYTNKEKIAQAIGFPLEDLCMGCITGDYL